MFKPGDLVTVDHPRWGGTWSITKVNPRTYKLRATDDSQRVLTAHHSLVLAANAGDASPSTMQPYRAPLHAGQIVRWANNGETKLYVVLADKVDRVNITSLGGDGGRYWRVSPRNLTVLDAANVLNVVSTLTDMVRS